MHTVAPLPSTPACLLAFLLGPGLQPAYTVSHFLTFLFFPVPDIRALPLLALCVTLNVYEVEIGFAAWHVLALWLYSQAGGAGKICQW